MRISPGFGRGTSVSRITSGELIRSSVIRRQAAMDPISPITYHVAGMAVQPTPIFRILPS
jgi:hypothetical protein